MVGLYEILGDLEFEHEKKPAPAGQAYKGLSGGPTVDQMLNGVIWR